MLKNIRLNCVSPGFIATDMTKDLKEEYQNELMKNIPINRLGEGKDIANAVIFLASEAHLILQVKLYMLMVGCIWLD